MRRFCSAHRPRLLALLLAVATLAVYAPVSGYDFIDMDDRLYVLDNEHVKSGLDLEGVVWALRSTESSNWHPLTWISHMLDVELYGLDAGGHHLTSLLLHLASTLLLFLLLERMTHATGRSACVAALFALHPLHVESVAWVAERKDVLCGLLWMATLWCYVRYVEQPSAHVACSRWLDTRSPGADRRKTNFTPRYGPRAAPQRIALPRESEPRAVCAWSIHAERD